MSMPQTRAATGSGSASNRGEKFRCVLAPGWPHILCWRPFTSCFRSKE